MASETCASNENLVVQETGLDSARIKKMFNDVDSDVNYYKKMSEVFKTAKKTYESNR